MDTLSAIETILADDRLDAEECAESKCQCIEDFITALGWEPVRDSLLSILAEDRRRRDYQVAAQVLWAAVLDKHDLPANRVIALLYHRFDPRDEEDNLIWSITCKLKQVDYLSSYDPLQDPAVQVELNVIGRQ